MALNDRSTDIKHGLPGQLLGSVPLQTGLESKVSPSHQALLQHLLQKEQMRQQKMFSSGRVSSRKSASKNLNVTCNSTLLLIFKAKAPCRHIPSPPWPWRTGPPVGPKYPNTDPWTGPSLHRYHRTHWPNWSFSNNTSTSWRNRSSTSSRFISIRYSAIHNSEGTIWTFLLFAKASIHPLNFSQGGLV